MSLPDPTLRTRVEFVVCGTPGAQGSKRHVGGGRMVESSASVQPWRDAVRSEAQKLLGDRPPLAGPLAVTLVFTVRKPASAPKRVRAWPTKKPDIDKITRSTLDALTQAGAWQDDSQVVDLYVRKRYAGDPGCMLRPGVRVAVSPIEPGQE